MEVIEVMEEQYRLNQLCSNLKEYGKKKHIEKCKNIDKQEVVICKLQKVLNITKHHCQDADTSGFNYKKLF